MTTSLRTATPADADSLAALAAITFPLACPPGADPAAVAEHVRTQLSPERFVAWTASADHTLLVAEALGSPGSPDGGAGASDDAGGLVGYALLVRGVPVDADIVAVVGDEPSVELSKIYVHPASQGTGVASSLLQAALDAAPALVPDRAVWLGTNGQNARAQAFYRKHGFELAGTRTYVVGGEAHDDVVMVRPLG
ncbi:N-acetyltransferase [Oerskovia turbata]|uniref:N-acetyltransferase n=1 Tax=Oerskovia turbata TaxID=1713 RepID=A0A4Q1KXQ3_9CELL|nr:N-acetyltransferase [Oerskovia turbata]RXR26592.1 N-acetyltransferase [Oerskovia turbata]RXR34289.1 N-acetyltransferase [Oerskovia turbata]TGJ94737.1 GNAT family N-acetyltransferase [Actinotalea fermentans ATCC 43279 = JCM 9966 = DSM 3133]